ncbi:hypothetical protein IFM89_026466 [Coptis chinensis]|uniref:Methyltransferase n=1 Tax=Coptis chinensis TaxID=261450 RepID=A0A835ID41_9MAGN|nr:hypothetical protein IFM89_026466 [Coptis chinensis]
MNRTTNSSTAMNRKQVCDDQHSELILCLDKDLIYQMRLKLDLSLVEHYERHCPLPERRFNCLIPPRTGYKVPIKWPRSIDEVWKANIPHVHLAHEKSDQNWMVEKAPNDVHQNQIQFAFERGIPTYLGVLGTKRLPYSSRSFELAHCSRCRIDWLQWDDILLLELDRPSLFHYTKARDELLKAAGELFTNVASGVLRVRFNHTYPLSQAEQGHVDLENH